jgi:hypothetical protein
MQTARSFRAEEAAEMNGRGSGEDARRSQREVYVLTGRCGRSSPLPGPSAAGSAPISATTTSPGSTTTGGCANYSPGSKTLGAAAFEDDPRWQRKPRTTTPRDTGQTTT